jgi:drug/metabolite transporter (DMT)-like permease
MPPINATIFGNLSTAISIVAGVVFLNESLKYYHIICSILIIIGVIGVSMPKRKKRLERGSK